jgi:hypothetical protein
MSHITCYKTCLKDAAYEGKLKKGGGSQVSLASVLSPIARAWLAYCSDGLLEISRNGVSKLRRALVPQPRQIDPLRYPLLTQ